MARKVNRCEYVIRRAGYSVDGQSVQLDGHGDTTKTCGKFGQPVPHTFHTRKPGTTAVYESIEGTVIRCPEHKEG